MKLNQCNSTGIKHLQAAKFSYPQVTDRITSAAKQPGIKIDPAGLPKRDKSMRTATFCCCARQKNPHGPVCSGWLMNDSRHRSKVVPLEYYRFAAKRQQYGIIFIWDHVTEALHRT